MLRNYIRIGWRNLIKNRFLTIINLIGLSFSVAFCLLLFLYIRYEQSYDSFHVKKDRLFRLEMTNVWNFENKQPEHHFFSFLTRENDVVNNTIFPVVVAGDLQQAFPEVKTVTRFKDEGGQLVKVNNEVFKEPHIIYADEHFFENFSFRLINGNAATLLKSRSNLVLSETTAKKYFGSENPVGKTISLLADSIQLFTVAGVAADAPSNSSIQYNWILPTNASPDYEENLQSRFNHGTHQYIIELKNGVDAAQFETKLNNWAKTYFEDYYKDFKGVNKSNFNLYLRPFAECHYNSSSPWGHYTNAKNIYQLACLVIIILLIASLNYILLAVSNAAARSQEVGVRKVMGAKRTSIIIQFWIETQIIVLAAVITGFILANILLPVFNRAIDTELHMGQFVWTEVFLTLLALCISLGLLAGFYPALLISRMKLVSVIKGMQTFKVNPRFSRILVIAQYTACVVMMIAAFVITRQMQYVNNKDLGFDREQVVMVDNPTFDFDFTGRLFSQLKDFSKLEPSILQYSAMNGGLDGGGNRNRFVLNGEDKWLTQLTVDYNYFNLLGLKFIKGRPFSPLLSSDTSSRLRPSVVNETLFSMLGKSAKLGEYNETIRSTIIGVVKDYHFESLSKKIEPEQHVLPGRYVGTFLFKIKAGKTQEAISRIEKEWKRLTGNYPFEYSFLDQRINQMYVSETRWQKTIQASCFFSILIACMGMFGLSAINAMNRTREIGIRKVLGARVRDIVVSLSTNFLVMITIAIAIAIPLAWWLMNKWLEDFAYRITISWWLLAVTGLAAMVVAMTTVGIQAIRAAMANPVNSLRSE